MEKTVCCSQNMGKNNLIKYQWISFIYYYRTFNDWNVFLLFDFHTSQHREEKRRDIHYWWEEESKKSFDNSISTA